MGFLLPPWAGLLCEVPAAARPWNSYLSLQVDIQVSLSFLQVKGEAALLKGTYVHFLSILSL